ncbi:hypothetical protein I312_105618 [Cryptococcus bacillisporus CA1280]|uniref:uncharacterized protein n=1 Tax=Cryptococcus bacillisporus CA1280 TaxID=1296109 RepID=UPI0033697A70
MKLHFTSLFHPTGSRNSTFDDYPTFNKLAVRDRLMTGGDPVRLQYMLPCPQSEFLELAWHGARDADNKSRIDYRPPSELV